MISVEHFVSDIDECASWGHNCPQLCNNVKGSRKCLCRDDFTDTSSGRGEQCRAGGQCVW